MSPMAIERNMSITLKAPPPSPVPTPSGPRATANEIFSHFLDKTLQSFAHYDPEKVVFPSLVSREPGSVSQFLRSVRELGVVVIGWQSSQDNIEEEEEEEELKELANETAEVFGVLQEGDTGFRKSFGGKRDEIIWAPCNYERMDWARQYIGPLLYQSFSEKMEKVGKKLEEVAEELGKILVENASKELGKNKRLRKGESVLSINKYNVNHHDTIIEEDYDEEEENDHSFDYTLSLHLPTQHCEFSIKSGPQVLFTFDAAPNTIIVTVGQQLEEWSMEEFKSVSGEIVDQPNLHASQSCFSMELKWSSLKLNHTNQKRMTCKRISIAKQCFIALIAVFFYSVFISKSSP